MHRNPRERCTDVSAVLEGIARRRRATYRVRNIAWLNNARCPGKPSLSLLDHIQHTARRDDVSGKLLLALVLQETQFYHGRHFERWWTGLFLVAANTRIRVFRDKSLGIASIKPSTAVRLLQTYWEDQWSARDARRVVARLHDVAIELAALELTGFLNRGASDRIAFVAYGATQVSAQELLRCPEAALGASLGLQRRFEQYAEHLRFLQDYQFPSQQTLLPEKMTP